MTDSNRHELGHFLRTRRERIAPADVGLPAGPRRRTVGLRREEVAVLAGLSPTWYTYLEQGRNINPSPEVLNSLARVLRLSEDERRYMHVLAYGEVLHPRPLAADVPPDQLLTQLLGLVGSIPYPIYIADRYCDLLAWNPAATEWFDDWSRLAPQNRNFLRWMLTSPTARERLPDWHEDAQDVVARWRGETAKWPNDERMWRLVTEFCRLSPEFARWWESRHVQEHRSKIRRFRHPRLGIQELRVVPLGGPELWPTGIVFHLPVRPTDSGT